MISLIAPIGRRLHVPLRECRCKYKQVPMKQKAIAFLASEGLFFLGADVGRELLCISRLQ